MYDYFNLGKEDRVLIEESANYIGPALQPSSLRYESLVKPLRSSPDRRMLESYCSRVRDVFNCWRDVTGGTGEVKVVPWTARTVPIGAAVIQLSMSKSKLAPRLEDDDVINEITRTLAQAASDAQEKTQTIPHITVLDRERILIIKPLVARFWLQRTAIEDANRIASDIQAMGHVRAEA